MIIKGKNIYKVYISGAITNNPNFKKEFEEAEKLLIEKGFMPLSPIRTYEHINNLGERKCMFASIRLMEESDAVFELPKVVVSDGATIEDLLAKKCDMPIITKEDLG